MDLGDKPCAADGVVDQCVMICLPQRFTAMGLAPCVSCWGSIAQVIAVQMGRRLHTVGDGVRLWSCSDGVLQEQGGRDGVEASRSMVRQHIWSAVWRFFASDVGS